MKEKNIQPFSLAEVHPHKESVLYQRMNKNTEYLLSLDVERLIKPFRVYAKLESVVEDGYGGWEGPWSDNKGTFIGHYMTALCNTYQSEQDEMICKACEDRVSYIVDVLAEAQNVIAQIEGVGYPGEFGYLAAVPTTQLDCMEQQANGGIFSDGVPYYVHHKMLRGLFSAYSVLKIEKAKVIAQGMTAYFYKRNKDFSREKLEKMMNSHRYPVQYFKEIGGIQEILIDWYRVTEDSVFWNLSEIFDRDSFHNDLIQNRDELGVNMQHANSEVPCVVGMAKHYDVKGNSAYKTGVLNFLRWIEEDHASPIGAISGKSAYPDYDSELFHYPKIQYNHMVGNHVKLSSGESCCSHNLNLLSEHGFLWTGDSSYMNRFETRLVNAVLGQQDPQTGMFVYNLNIQPNSKKEFGTQDDSFWCCYCSGVEAFSSLQRGAFHHQENHLWVNQFVSADINWEEQDVVVSCKTDFPNSGNVSLTVKTNSSKEISFHIRKPEWVEDTPTVFYQGAEMNATLEDGYLTVSGTFSNEDTLEFTLPFAFRTGFLLDRPEYGYLFYGPHLMVASGYDGALYKGTMDDLIASLRPTGYPLEFDTAMNGRVVFTPLSVVRNETYSGFIRVAQPAEDTMTDVIDLGKKQSLEEHEFIGKSEQMVYHNGLYGIETDVGGSLEYTVKIDPHAQMQVRCYYKGDDTHFFGMFDAAAARLRLFDLQLKQADGSWKAFATQTIDHLNPNGIEHINYPIPTELTAGKTELRLRFVAKNFGTAHGVVGGLYNKIEVFYVLGNEASMRKGV